PAGAAARGVDAVAGRAVLRDCAGQEVVDAQELAGPDRRLGVDVARQAQALLLHQRRELLALDDAEAPALDQLGDEDVLRGLVAHPRRGALLRAVRLHDNGWRELDAAPPIDRSSGRPWSFVDLPPSLRLEVWTRGTARYVDEDPYVALLIVEHALALHAEA